jgi:hypothetical protein
MSETSGIRACIPLPVQIVIDDVGWRLGRDGSAGNQPYRTGIARDHVPADYEAIARLGRSLGMRPQCQLVLGEWDTTNLLRKVPTATWEGDRWDNAPRLGEWLDASAAALRANAEYLELCLHALQHEYWIDGQMTRAEWADPDGTMRPRDQVLAHLDAFFDIFDRHKLGPRPTYMVPTAYCHTFAAPDGQSFAEVLAGYGLRGIFEPFNSMAKGRQPRHEWFDFDRGLITVNRDHDLFPWHVIGGVPERPFDGPVCAMHWPNMLHIDPSRNAEIVDGWVKMLQGVDREVDRMLSPNTEAFCAQLIHHGVTRLAVQGDTIDIDAADYFRQPWKSRAGDALTLRVQSQREIQLNFAGRSLQPTRIARNGDSVLATFVVEVSADNPRVKLTFLQ